ncbi:MAG: hypothetical protein NTX86_05850 [Candidatus Dependentiae bacterium]|nr:hypothetical protein [Candidatus Dependentiae bacterium]
MKSHNSYLLSLFFAIATLFSATNMHAYLYRDEAITEATDIGYKLFLVYNLDADTQEKVTEFIEDFSKNTFTYDIPYSQFNRENIAEMIIVAAAEWICNQAMNVASGEILRDSTFRPHFTGTNQFNLKTMRTIIHKAIDIQLKRITKKPLEKVMSGDFYQFIGEGLRIKVREQLQEIVNRECAAYCGDDNQGLILLTCGHKLHQTCLNSLQRIQCPVCSDSLLYLRPAAPAPVYQSAMPAPSAPLYQPAPKPQAPKPVFQPAAPRPSYQPVYQAPKPVYQSQKPRPEIHLSNEEAAALLIGTASVVGIALVVWALNTLINHA